MAKEIRTIIWCDGTQHGEDEQVEATATHRFAIDTLKERELDLCELCEKELLSELIDVLKLNGQPINRTAPTGVSGGQATGPKPCDVDGCEFVAKSAAGLGTHKARVHGIPGTSK